MPARRQRTGLGLAVADDAHGQQVGVVEHGSVGMDERVAELAALVDRAGCLRCDVAGDPARERELPKQPPQPLLIVTDVRVDLAVGALEVGVGDESWAAVPGTGDEDRAEVPLLDRAIHVHVEEVQPRSRSPVAEQARLDLIGAQGFAQQRVVEQVDLSYREVVRGPPVRVDQAQIIGHDAARTLTALPGSLVTRRSRRGRRGRRERRDHREHAGSTHCSAPSAPRRLRPDRRPSAAGATGVGGERSRVGPARTARARAE